METDIQSGARGVLTTGKTKQKLIIVCHGYKSHSGHPALVAIVKGLNAKGYATYSLNFSKAATIDIKKQVEEIVETAESHHEYREIILLAGSFGALSSSIAARFIPRIGGLVTINGFFGSGKLDRKHSNAYTAVKLMALISSKHRAILKYFKDELQPASITAPVLVIHSKTDEIVAYQGSVDFYKALQAPKQFKSLRTADHHLHAASDIDAIIGWIAVWLKGKQT